MKEKQSFSVTYKWISFGLSLLALVLFALTFFIRIPGLEFFFVALSLVSLVVGCVFLYLSYKGERGRRVNYFLYDRRRKTKISPKELSFDFMHDNLTYFVSGFADDALSLWRGIPRELEMELEAHPAFRTPVAFLMAYELSGSAAEDIEALFALADRKTVSFVCRAMKDGGDQEMADIVFEMKTSPERMASRVVPFFQKNRRPFEARIYRFIKSHIEEFEGNFFSESQR